VLRGVRADLSVVEVDVGDQFHRLWVPGVQRLIVEGYERIDVLVEEYIIDEDFVPAVNAQAQVTELEPLLDRLRKHAVVALRRLAQEVPHLRDVLPLFAARDRVVLGC